MVVYTQTTFNLVCHCVCKRLSIGTSRVVKGFDGALPCVLLRAMMTTAMQMIDSPFMFLTLGSCRVRGLGI